ncbi:hypothetical protein KIN20_030171 [Parelaphostrongylus tenuis]|uniref:Uncharacterized protein n=1 Tax=Parelaphostrongylus tenuis TaxID=148309 RepID=A0AAD5R3E4_PARTN|nr:hypothetical protein KIN20_030171 [Parelaphostrongylus tenuis]
MIQPKLRAACRRTKKVHDVASTAQSKTADRIFSTTKELLKERRKLKVNPNASI